MIQIYRKEENIYQIKGYEERLVAQNSSQKVSDWFLAKAKVLEKAECDTLAFKALDQALELFKEKNKHFFNIQLYKSHLLIKLQ